MADFTFINQSPVDYDTDTKTYKPTSNSNMSPDFTDSIGRIYSLQVSRDIPIAGLTFSPVNAIPTRRPAGGQLYPRGVYNK
jgi:hypothetical protein